MPVKRSGTLVRTLEISLASFVVLAFPMPPSLFCVAHRHSLWADDEVPGDGQHDARWKHLQGHPRPGEASGNGALPRESER